VAFSALSVRIQHLHRVQHWFIGLLTCIIVFYASLVDVRLSCACALSCLLHCHSLPFMALKFVFIEVSICLVKHSYCGYIIIVVSGNSWVVRH
jgi:hypothetical protein